MNEMLFVNFKEEGKGYACPRIEVLYCGADAPLLDSPTAGFDGDEGGLVMDELD